MNWACCCILWICNRIRVEFEGIYAYHESGCLLEICQWCGEPCVAGAEVSLNVYTLCIQNTRTRVSSVSIATGWTVEVRFSAGSSSSLFLSVQTVSDTHPGSYLMGTGGLFPGKKSGLGMKLTSHLHLVPRSRMMELYLHFTIWFCGIELNSLSTAISLLLYRTYFFGACS
jgi:hypothetical protein